MSKNNKGKNAAAGNSSPEASAAPDFSRGFSAPAGFVKHSEDIDGFWNDEKGVLHFIPRTVKAFDSKLDRTRPSILIIGEVTSPSPAIARGPDDEDTEVVLIPGQIVGVWGKPGMKGLRDARGVKCIVVPAGEKDIGKPQPMRLYQVHTEGTGAPLVIDDDSRDHSFGASTFLDRKDERKVRRGGGTPTAVDSGGVPLDANGKPIF